MVEDRSTRRKRQGSFYLRAPVPLSLLTYAPTLGAVQKNKHIYKIKSPEEEELQIIVIKIGSTPVNLQELLKSLFEKINKPK